MRRYLDQHSQPICVTRPSSHRRPELQRDSHNRASQRFLAILLLYFTEYARREQDSDCYHRLCANSTGWPVKVAVTGQSVTVHLAIGEALACNQRMSITEA